MMLVESGHLYAFYIPSPYSTDPSLHIHESLDVPLISILAMYCIVCLLGKASRWHQRAHCGEEHVSSGDVSLHSTRKDNGAALSLGLLLWLAVPHE